MCEKKCKSTKVQTGEIFDWTATIDAGVCYQDLRRRFSTQSKYDEAME